MQKISILKPIKSHIQELHALFEATITYAFEKEGLGDELEEIKGQTTEKKQLLKEYIESNGTERFFLIARCDSKIVGTIAYGPCGQEIMECSNGDLKSIGEIGTVYVLPKYQKKGIGTLLLNSMFIALLSRNIEEFCLDSGYKRAQRIWLEKLGEPNIIKKDYWGEGANHMIWHRRLEDIMANETSPWSLEFLHNSS